MLCTYHCQNGIEDDVQLYHCGVFVIQNGTGQFKSSVTCGQVEIIQDVLVSANVRGNSIYRKSETD